MQYALHRFTILDVRLQCILCNKQVCWLVKVIHEWEGKCSPSPELWLFIGTPRSISQNKED